MKASLVTTVPVIHPDCIVECKADGLAQGSLISKVQPVGL